MTDQNDSQHPPSGDGYTSSPIDQQPPSGLLFQYAEQNYWDLFLQRCKTHPQDARYDNDEFSGRTVFQHMTCRELDQIPLECWEAVVKAYPQATIMRYPGDLDDFTPLHIVACKIVGDVSPKVFKLILERCVPPSLVFVRSLLSPELPSEVIQEHIYPFLGNDATRTTRDGNTVLYMLFRFQVIPNISACLEALLQKAPQLASIAGEQNLYPIHLAVETTGQRHQVRKTPKEV